MKAARNKDGSLWIFNDTPIRNKDSWQKKLNTDAMQLDINRFPSLSWDDEPIDVSLYSRDMINNLKEVYTEKGYENSLPLWKSIKDKNITLPPSNKIILATDGIDYSIISVEVLLDTIDKPFNRWTHWMNIPSL